MGVVIGVIIIDASSATVVCVTYNWFTVPAQVVPPGKHTKREGVAG